MNMLHSPQLELRHQRFKRHTVSSVVQAVTDAVEELITPRNLTAFSLPDEDTVKAFRAKLARLTLAEIGTSLHQKALDREQVPHTEAVEMYHTDLEGPIEQILSDWRKTSRVFKKSPSFKDFDEESPAYHQLLRLERDVPEHASDAEQQQYELMRMAVMRPMTPDDIESGLIEASYEPYVIDEPTLNLLADGDSAGFEATQKRLVWHFAEPQGDDPSVKDQMLRDLQRTTRASRHDPQYVGWVLDVHGKPVNWATHESLPKGVKRWKSESAYEAQKSIRKQMKHGVNRGKMQYNRSAEEIRIQLFRQSQRVLRFDTIIKHARFAALELLCQSANYAYDRNDELEFFQMYALHDLRTSPPILGLPRNIIPLGSHHGSISRFGDVGCRIVAFDLNTKKRGPKRKVSEYAVETAEGEDPLTAITKKLRVDSEKTLCPDWVVMVGDAKKVADNTYTQRKAMHLLHGDPSEVERFIPLRF